MQGLHLPLEEMLGRQLLPANLIAKQFDEQYGTPSAQFEFIAFLDGQGVKQAMHGPYSDDSFWFTDTKYPTFDLAGAKKLVAEYEKEKGPIKFDYSGNQDPFIVTYMQLFQSMWKDAGIDANIVSKAQGDNVSATLSGNFQVTGWGGIGGDDPDNDYTYFHSGGLNIAGFTSPVIDAAMDKGRALSDQQARKAEYEI